MQVTLPYPPSANRYLRHTARGTYRTSEANRYLEAARWEAKRRFCMTFGMNVDPLKCVVAVAAKLHPKLTAKGKASETRIDLDNALKVALDALQGVVYENDKQIRRITLEIGEPMKDGGLTLEVYAP